MQHIEQAAHFTRASGAPNAYIEHLRGAAMSIGTYSVPAGGTDDQTPHAEDEVYVVLSGRAQFTSGGQTVLAGPGTTLFVPAGEKHCFHHVTEDLAVLAVLSPPYTGRHA